MKKNETHIINGWCAVICLSVPAYLVVLLQLRDNAIVEVVDELLLIWCPGGDATNTFHQVGDSGVEVVVRGASVCR